MNTKELQWRNADPDGLIPTNEVHVWRLFPNTIGFQIESLQKILSADELERARKFHFEKDRRRFIMARGILRTILARYLDIKPQQVSFEYASFGKPILATDFVRGNISFNLSHSGEMVLYAITRNHKIGIDVERINDNVDVMQIASRFFSPCEIVELEKAYEKNHSEIFFRYWTRKEAFVKGLGKGVSFPMEHIDVSLINDKFLPPIKLAGENCEYPWLYIRDLFPGDGYAAALATDRIDSNISFWHYSG